MTFIKLDISSFSFRNRVDSGDATTTRTSQIYTFNRVKHSVLHERLSFYKFQRQFSFFPQDNLFCDVAEMSKLTFSTFLQTVHTV